MSKKRKCENCENCVYSVHRKNGVQSYVRKCVVTKRTIAKHHVCDKFQLGSPAVGIV